jgi:hypothetical protein
MTSDLDYPSIHHLWNLAALNPLPKSYTVPLSIFPIN